MIKVPTDTTASINSALDSELQGRIHKAINENKESKDVFKLCQAYASTISDWVDSKIPYSRPFQGSKTQPINPIIIHLTLASKDDKVAGTCIVKYSKLEDLKYQGKNIDSDPVRIILLIEAITKKPAHFKQVRLAITVYDYLAKGLIS
jgi:hypothetical protein